MGTPLYLYVRIPTFHFTCCHLQFSGAPGLPTYALDCANTGQGTITGPPLHIAKMTEETKLTAKLELTGVKNGISVERHVTCIPSRGAANIKVSHKTQAGLEELKNGQEIFGSAGDTIKGISKWGQFSDWYEALYFVLFLLLLTAGFNK